MVDVWPAECMNEPCTSICRLYITLGWCKIQFFIQSCGSGSRVLMTKKFKKKIQLKFFLSIDLHKGRPLQEKPSDLKREHPVLQKMKFDNFKFSGSFLNRGIFGDFSLCTVQCIQRSTLLYLSPLNFHCVGGWWERTQDCSDFSIDNQTL